MKWVNSSKNYFNSKPSRHLVDNRNIRKCCEICSELTTKTPERRQWRFYC